MVYRFFDKTSQGSGLANNKENIQLANELHNQLLKNLEKERCIHHLETISGVLI